MLPVKAKASYQILFDLKSDIEKQTRHVNGVAKKQRVNTTSDRALNLRVSSIYSQRETRENGPRRRLRAQVRGQGLGLSFQPVVEGVQRSTRGGHLHKGVRAILRLEVDSAAAVGNHVDGIA